MTEEELPFVPVKEISFEATTGDRPEPLDNGEPGFRLTGLREVSGTFSGKLEDGLAEWLAPSTGPITMYFYGPDPDLPWWRHWYYRIREMVRGTPYPTVVLASGPATMAFEEEREDGDDIVMTGTFTKAGKWYFKDEEVNQ